MAKKSKIQKKAIHSKAKSYRVEQDSMGPIQVPHDRYYGAQTARSLVYFDIGDDVMPRSIIRALGLIKKAAAKVNREYGLLSADKSKLIVEASEEVIEGHLDDHFPLNIWQTGSGTQTNMNANEVIANRAIELAGGKLGSRSPIHPNDDVNMSQSSNDVFPTAIHIAVAEEIQYRLLPSLEKLYQGIIQKKESFSKIVKVGRTHLMDAVPLTLWQEFSGYASQIEANVKRIKSSLPGVYELAIGGTAVGTGLNSPQGFDKEMANEIADATNLPFTSAVNKFAALAAHDALVFVSGTLKTLAASLMKIARDIAWMGSGPSCGLNELILPANEPGSSIMPGKVNPTQCESIIMVATQVMAHDVAITFAGSQGNFELNVFKPMIAFNLLSSIALLSDSCRSFNEHLIQHLKANETQIHKFLDHSLMLVTALAPKVGYDQASKISQKAYKEGISLKEACVKMKILSGKEYDLLVDPTKMTSPKPIMKKSKPVKKKVIVEAETYFRK